MSNPRCDGAHCASASGEVRRLDIGGDSAAHLCRACFDNEMQWRKERNDCQPPAARFTIPTWESLEVVK